jgi:hypothetical protein
MDGFFSIHSPVVSNDGERVTFTTNLNGSEKPAYISRTALIQLDGIKGNELLQIFAAVEVKIARAARDHILRNPHLSIVVLGSGDF